MRADDAGTEKFSEGRWEVIAVEEAGPRRL